MMATRVNPAWLKKYIGEYNETGRVDVTTDFIGAAQALIVFLSNKNVAFEVYNIGAGVKRITTETKKCPCCKCDL